MNCSRRGRPIPTAAVLRGLVIFPKLEADEKLLAGLANIG